MSYEQCYNRGCGQKFNPEENNADSCRHHPGDPVFHDAYKGWSCCNKKCTDFTEFLNIQGCTLSKHSNEKPPEPVKEPCSNIIDDEVIEVKPIINVALPRPPLGTKMVILQPEIAASLQQQLKNTAARITEMSKDDGVTVKIGTGCQNKGCTARYEGVEGNVSQCEYHPGVPIFHEGLKFWSCCQKRTSDFDVFLKQPGCTLGAHLWTKQDVNSETVQCRWDFHQTGSHVVVSIYAKSYCPIKSSIEINPIRLLVKLVFPQEQNATFLLDHELHGIVKVENCQATMYGTKVEIKMRKAEIGTWPRLEVIKKAVETTKPLETVQTELVPSVEAVDLTDL